MVDVDVDLGAGMNRQETFTVKPARNCGHLPPHQPRVGRVIEPASTLRLVLRTCGEMARITEKMLLQIALLYQIEKTVCGKVPPDRLAARRENAAQIIAALKPWLETQLSRMLEKSLLDEDICYSLHVATSKASMV